ncbi:MULTISPECIES: alpha/beta hydrolase [unclassified Pedobacter]|uniref:alpha/beta hydrolase n=1 Tax=unclassified Pedobacter TaxID=2628915 RepID=UPI00141FE8DF|nr:MULTISPECIES: alpha/beta hydrolase [unclassified Pedobacter]NII81991.1 acetyl esterase/lipase [Pedobacter sp. SG908]NMN35995.1 acetyl esterase/lipase [Pedobacter sp. SG918]
MNRAFIFFFYILSSSFCYAQDLTIPLYQGQVPNAKKTPADYIEETDSSGLIKNVSMPTMQAYLPNKNKANGTAVIIFAGGGYFVLAPKKCIEIAKAFNTLGVAAFVVKYRLPSDKIMNDKTIGPLQDAQTAIKMVRMRAGEWNINPNKIGMMGLSAGGHLVSTEGTQLNRVVIDNKENTSLRPDFMILLYPVIIYDPDIPRTRENLIGKKPTPQTLGLYSTNKSVSQATPPTFLVHAADDDVIPVKNSLQFFDALQKAKVKSEMHILQTGGHGFGIYDEENKDSWFVSCYKWMIKNGFVPAD